MSESKSSLQVQVQITEGDLERLKTNRIEMVKLAEEEMLWLAERLKEVGQPAPHPLEKGLLLFYLAEKAFNSGSNKHSTNSGKTE